MSAPTHRFVQVGGKTVKVTLAQQRVMKWLGHGWRSAPGSGSAIMVNGERVCNVDTMTTLCRNGLVVLDSPGCYSATQAGRTAAADMGL